MDISYEVTIKGNTSQVSIQSSAQISGSLRRLYHALLVMLAVLASIVSSSSGGSNYLGQGIELARSIMLALGQ